MTIHELAASFQKLEKISSRLEITRVVSELFTRAHEDEITPLSYLLQGRLAPKFEGIEFQLAEKMIIRILALTYSQEERHVIKQFKEIGDLGSVVVQLAGHTATKKVHQGGSLHITSVYNELLKIAKEEGQGSQERKVKRFSELLKTLDPESAKFMVRMPIGALRLGFSDMTILDALSWMKTGNKSLRKILEDAYNVSADIGRIARIVKTKGIDGIKKITVRPGIPIRPQQAERLPNSAEIIKKLGTCAVEYKLDGLRAQVHIFRSRKPEAGSRIASPAQLKLAEVAHEKIVRIFSRNLENTTHMFPEIVEAARKLPVESAILDGEAIGYHPETGKLLPFQETSQRKRKHGIEELSKTIPIKYFAFDLLYKDGEELLKKPFKERRALLSRLIPETTPSLELAFEETAQTPEHITTLFNRAIKQRFEGVMTKKLESPYKAGARDFTWVKLKHAGEGMLADTIDAVVMGLYRGKGKRSGFGIGAFLVGVQDSPPNDQRLTPNAFFVTIAKIGTGLSDEQWIELRQKCEKNAVKIMPDSYKVPKELVPDIWTSPHIVVEIAADEITKSPIHTAGIALRFPRLIRFRDDKATDDATTLSEVQKLQSL